MVALTGPSGSGKSSLLNCLGLLERPSSGTLAIDGRTVGSIGPWRRRQLFRSQLGFLFQNFGLVETWTVQQNLDVALRLRSGGRRERRNSAREALEQVGLNLTGDERIRTLSGGEQQRVAFARLLIKQPRLVIADEPTAALDAENARTITDLLMMLRDEGAAVIVSTHADMVARSADTVVNVASFASATAV
jgi:putative ABC transport system ATP-binding protein